MEPAVEEIGAVSRSLAKALAHPLRFRILIEANQRPMSVTEFVKMFPEHSHAKVYGHFRTLEECGCIELIETKTGGDRRGGVEHFYRATQRTLFDQSSWPSLPKSAQEQMTAVAFTTYVEQVADAINAGTIDKQSDRHFSWSPGCFDRRAWDETIEELEEVFSRLPKRMADAATRIASEGGESIPVIVALACFESPARQGMSDKTSP